MPRIRTALIAALALATATVVVAQEQQHRPLSPPGTASTQVGGQWVKRDNGEMNYKDGKWIDIDYSRPIRGGRVEPWGSEA
jgi:hypothetical protein